MKPCRGCIHYRSIYSSGTINCCHYLIDTDSTRGCPVDDATNGQQAGIFGKMDIENMSGGKHMANRKNQANQEKKLWLSRYTDTQQRINRLEAELSDWDEKRLVVRMENAKQINELVRQINNEIDQLVTIRLDIMHAIDTIPDDRLRLLMEYRYIDGKRWEQIAVDMGYDYRWVLRLHGQALEKMEMVIN